MALDEEFLTAEQECLIRIFRGGLRGRVVDHFDALIGSVDVLSYTLGRILKPADRAKLEPLLEEMSQRLALLERLSVQTADIATGSALRELQKMEPLELVILLEEFGRDLNAALAEQNFHALVRVESDLSAVSIQGNAALINGLLSNVFSNAVRRDPDVMLTLKVTRERRLVCFSGSELPQEVWDLLVNGHLQGDLLERGGTGLLLIREYAGCLGWKIECWENALSFVLPAFDLANLEFHSETGQEELQGISRRRIIGRELASLEEAR